MEKFIVSARKYRPQTFATVVGQAHITTTLKNAIRNQQLAHAFLFCGPRGVGKTTCARILAKTINCENKTAESEACDTCHSCVSFNEGSSLNIHELDAASNNSVDDIRSLVEQVRFAPQAGHYKVYIIDEVHMLSSAAFNAFLKTLEEPPPYAIFILATTEKHKILPTILSRCQIFDFKRITTQDTADHLQEICTKETVQAEMPALQLIAQKSEGCMRDALSILDKIVSFTNGELSYANTLEHLNILDADYYFKLMQAMKAQDLTAALLMYDEINRKGFEGDTILNGFAEFIRNLLVCKDPKAASLLDVVESFKTRYLEMAHTIPAALLISALNLLAEAEMQYKTARNKRLHIELALIKLCYLSQAIELSENGDSLVKKKIADRPLAFRTAALKTAVKATVPLAGAGSSTPAAGVPTTTAGAPDSTPKPIAPVTTPVTENGAKLLIEKERDSPVPPAAKTPSIKLGALSKLREQIAQSNKSEDAKKTAIPLEINLLRKCWKEFTEKLIAAKNPAVQSFDLADLRMNDSSNFTIVSANNLEQKFIEGEKRELAEFIQETFCNPAIQLHFLVEEDPNRLDQYEKPQTAKDTFIEMNAQYPLLNELRRRLKLEIGS